MKKNTLFTGLFLAASIFAAKAQSPYSGEDLGCGTDIMMAKVFAAHPDIKAQFDANERLAEKQDSIDFSHNYYRQSQQAMMPTVYTVPVVFHIIHQYGSENISDAQVLDEMRILNEDYAKLNPDTTAIESSFVSIAASANIQFKLANIDPNGNCTNGIDRVYSYLTNAADDNSKLDPWPRDKYLNVWVVKTIGTAGVAGYAYLPGTAPSSTTDGILILSSYIGSIGSSTASHSRSLTHEIGHFLNLKHVWGNTNTPSTDCGATGTCGDDGVNDTPHTKGWGFCCNLANDDICVPGTHENVQNYMEYSYCSCMFTAGQVTRMRSALTSATAQRSSLWTASNLVATGVSNNPPTVCKPNADFVPNNITMVCAGSSVTFTDASWNGHPTSWNWSFPGGTPATSTDSIPVIQYNTPGTYNVTLTASNSSGSSTTTKNGIVIVSANTAQYNSWQYYEGFESATTFTSDWIVNNPEGNGWARSTAAAYTGTGSARLANTSSMGGQVDELISPSIDFSAIGSTTMTFRIAYAQRTSTSADKLRVLVSTNCGASWTQRYVKIGATLSTATATTSNFMPNSSQWRQETLNLSNLATQTNVRIKFEFTSDGGNNIYLDDINLTGPSAVSTPDAAIQNFDVFPNPVNDNTLISFSLQDKEKVDLSIYDMTGREVMTVYSGDLDAGDHQFPLNTSGTLSPGVYLVRMVTVSGRSVTQRMIVD